MAGLTGMRTTLLLFDSATWTQYALSKSRPILPFISSHCLGWQDLPQPLLVGNCRGWCTNSTCPTGPEGFLLLLFLLWQFSFALGPGLWKIRVQYDSDLLPKFSWEIQGRNGECWSYTAHNSARTEGRFMGAGKGISLAEGLLFLPKFKGSFSNNRDITAC